MTYVATFGVEDAGAVDAPTPRLFTWPGKRPRPYRRGSLLLASQPWELMAMRWDLGDQDREPLRRATQAAFDLFTDVGRGARLLFEASFGRSGVAQMKVARPSPGTRLVGAFLSKDEFVGLRLYWRDELPFRDRNDGAKVIDYQSLVEEAVREWGALLPGIPRLHMKALFPGDRG